MDDLKEDLLDTAAVLKEKFMRIGIKSWLLILVTLATGPVFYFVLAFALVKVIISGLLVLYILQTWLKKCQSNI